MENRQMPQTCRFYYEDSHRRSPRKECRLIERNPASDPWNERLCRSCPVPRILEQNPCANLALEAGVKSRFGLFPRVAVLVVCTARLEEIDDAATCRRGCEQFESLE
jgi:hypothetical protein